MSFSNNYNGNNNQSGPKIFEGTEGLDEFIKNLERYFFATAKLSCKQDVVHNQLDLIVELHFNFSISDCLRHFNNGDWGSYSISQESSINMSTTMCRALKRL
ncbi:MAG: hypothetical protein VX772_10515, partial [Bacteroidota bacterium]|nr:hypothetical protein [Bacteroidota bacterium]